MDGTMAYSSRYLGFCTNEGRKAAASEGEKSRLPHAASGEGGQERMKDARYWVTQQWLRMQ